MNLIDVQENETIDALISYEFKNANTDLDCENAVFNILKERQLKDVTTDIFIEDMFSNNRNTEDLTNKTRENNRFNFLAYVYTYLKLKIKFNLPQLLNNEDIILKSGEDVYLLFKGGNMMYYKYEELKQQVKPELQDNFYKMFDDNFKISDFDFTCYITVRDRERFYKVKKVVSQLLWQETVNIRNFFEHYMSLSIDIKNYPSLENSGVSNDVFKSFEIPDNIKETEQDKENRINTIKQSMFNDDVLQTPNDIHTYVINKAMEIVEPDYDVQTDVIDYVQIQSSVWFLRKYLYRKTIYHKTTNKVSNFFNEQYDKENNEIRITIVNMLKKVSVYLTLLGFLNPDYTYKDFIKEQSNIHIPTILYIHEFLVVIEKYKDIIIDINSTEQNIEFILQRVHMFLDAYINEFSSIYKQRIIESDFYNIFIINNLLENIKNKFIQKQNTIEVCQTIYDEYRSFDEDVGKLKNKQNYNIISLKNKSFDVYMKKREDFYIQPDLLKDNTTYIDKQTSNYHYVYLNSTIKKIRNQFSSVVDFDLLRVKFNVDLVIKSTVNDDAPLPNNVNELTVKIPSEFIDISICSFEDTALVQFRNHTEDGLGLFTIMNGDLRLECLGYSIDFMVHDLIYVLYEQNIFTPWADLKYQKRIQRLNSLQMLSYINDKKSLKSYLLSILVVDIIINYADIYALTKSNSRDPDDLLRLLTSVSDNIFNNYKKYNLETVFNILPTILLDVIFNKYLEEYKHLQSSIPYPDQVIGTIIFYAVMQNKYDDIIPDKKLVQDVINRYRADYLFLPADDEDIEDTIHKSKQYIKDMNNTYNQMYDIVKVQAQSGGSNIVKKKKKRVTKMKTFF
jgi:hypothetical protein